jgi:hypothetical protein
MIGKPADFHRIFRRGREIMAWQQTVAQTDYASGRLEWAGGGDPDVYTKPGRTTQVTLVANNVRPAEDWKSVFVDVYYSVKEMASNNTFLRWRGTATLPIPIDARRMRLMDVRDVNRTWYVKGQVHDNLELSDIAGTVIGPGSTYRIDGKGDDQYNAQIDLHLKVPLMYDDAS